MNEVYCVFCHSDKDIVSMGCLDFRVSACKECIDRLYDADIGDFLYVTNREENDLKRRKGRKSHAPVSVSSRKNRAISKRGHSLRDGIAHAIKRLFRKRRRL